MHWQERGPDNLFEGGDPYFQLRTGRQSPEGFAAPGSSGLWPVVVRLSDGDPAAFATETGVAAVPSFYTNTTGDLRRAKYCTALVTGEFFQALKSDGPVSRITVLPQIQGDLVATHQGSRPTIPAPGGKAKPGIVVMGIVDFGIAFAQERFRRDRYTTRIEYFWVQDGKPTVEATPSAASPVEVNPVPYGGEIAAPAIDGLLMMLAAGELADEDALYAQVAAQRLGRSWHWSISRRLTHGTHVMDVACGYGLDEAERTQRPIVAVQLSEAATRDTSGENLDAYALDSVRYILDRADTIARQHQCGALPVVINFSWGNVAGPHDGSSDLEQAIDEIMRKRRKIAPTEIVLPAGNSNLSRSHAAFRFDGPTQPLRWRVLPDDKTPSFLEVWLPQSDLVQQARIRLRIIPPGASDKDSIPWLAEMSGHGLQWQAEDGAVLCEARYRYMPAPTRRGMFLIALQPTIRADAAAPAAPSGVWTIELENQSFGPNDLIEAWIQRDDTPLGFRGRGRQSYFDDPHYLRFDAQGRVIDRDDHPEQKESPSVVKRAGSTNAIATGTETVVVGGFLRKEGRPAPYSAARAGAAEPPPRYLAPSDDSDVHGGILAAGTRSGSVAAMNGTSVAAPQVARWIANQLAEPSKSIVNSEAPEITHDGWSDPSFPGAGIVPHRDTPSWPRPRPGKRAAEGVVHDAQTGRPAAPRAVWRPDPAGWEK